MPSERMVGPDEPLMIAWKAYQATPEYANTKRWAVHAEHVEGSLWAAFDAGFRASAPAAPAPHKHRCLRCDQEFDCQTPGVCVANVDVLPRIIVPDATQPGGVRIFDHCHQYHGHWGSVTWDAEARVYHGEVAIAPDVVTFEGATEREAVQAFHDSVDDYLAMCDESRHRAPVPAAPAPHSILAGAPGSGRHIDFPPPAPEAATSTTPLSGHGIVECRGHWHVTNAATGDHLIVPGDPFPTRDAALDAAEAPNRGNAAPEAARETDDDAQIIQRARDEISRLCQGRGRMTRGGLAGRDWTMCIPRRDDDSDAIFADLADLAVRLRAALAAAETERDQFRTLALAHPGLSAARAARPEGREG